MGDARRRQAPREMDDTIFSLNGRLVPPREAVVSVTDRGFLYGDGIFETLHAYGRKLFRRREHLERLAQGAARLFLALTPNPCALAKWLEEAVLAAGFAEANVRLTVSRGMGPRGPSVPARLEPTVVITVSRHTRPPGKRLKHGASAVLASFRRQEAGVTAGLKTLNYLEQVLARREADLAGVDEAILLNSAGLLCEGSACNLALVRHGRLALPDPGRTGALPGIAQLTAVEAARSLGIPVAYTLLGPWDLGRAEEAFLSGSMREISPLVRVDGRPVGSGRPGPLTLRLMAEYRRMVERECAPFKYRV